eukprot:Gb_41317 [translate_table: standard]
MVTTHYNQMRLFVKLIHTNKSTKLTFAVTAKALEDVPTQKSLFQVCATVKSLPEGKAAHAQMLITGLNQNVFLWTKLMSVYSKCGNIADARQVFDKMPKRNLFSWNVMIGGYARNEQFEEALALYYIMRLEGMQPDNFTFPCVLKACGGLVALQKGMEIHNDIISSELEGDVFVGNALVAMYTKCGNIEHARHVFDKMSQRDVISWTAMIAGYAQNEMCDQALKLFRQMQVERVKPDSVTIASILPACADLGALHQGREIHGYITRSGIEWDVSVGNALVDIYAKCGSVEDARFMFDKMSRRDVVSWNVMIAGYTLNRCFNESLKLFGQMQKEGKEPNPVSISSVLPACAHLAALQQGKEIHNYIIRRDFESDNFVANGLIDMYAKSGSIHDAYQMFGQMFQRDVISWTSMIAGYGMHGYAEDALTVFHQMVQAGIKPNKITFTGLLSACSHAGLVDEGLQYFYCMCQDYGVTPAMEHYACIVDLLGRAGRLDLAYDFIKKLPLEPAASVWGALHNACRIHCNIELGELVADCLFEIEPENVGNYVLMSNIYAAAGRWDDVTKLRKLMKERGLKSSPGCSWIEIKSKMHVFCVGDRSHPQFEQIYATLKSLAWKLKKAGYVPDTKFVLHNVEEEEKEHILCGHSEKLAIAFGIINTCPNSPVRITKNLRICGDCHTATKFITKIVGREIIVRDANRFHYFKAGMCSCGDYW